MSQLIGTASNQVPTNGDLGSAAFMDTSAFYSTASNPVFRNKIINGDMRVDQRYLGSSHTYVYNASQETKYLADRFKATFFSFTSGAGNMATFQQVSDAPAGFNKSVKITSISGFTPGGANSGIGGFINQAIEGLNVVDLVNPAGGLYAMTVSFWVKASKTGVVSVSVESNATGGCHYVTGVTINASNTWEYKVVSIPASSFGAINTDNTIGLDLNIGLCTNGSWLVGVPNQWNTDANRGVLLANQTNFMSSANDTFQITGVQLEKGSQATPFEQRLYPIELTLCQRYYEKKLTLYSQGDFAYKPSCYWESCPINFAVPKRASPTVTADAVFLRSVTTPGGNLSYTGLTFNTNYIQFFLTSTTTQDTNQWMWSVQNWAASAEL